MMIYQLHKETSEVSEELLSLAGGPCREAVFQHLQTKCWEQGRTTQNAGVCDHREGLSWSAN